MKKQQKQLEKTKINLHEGGSAAVSDAQPVLVWVFGKGGVGKSQAAEAACITLMQLGYDVCAMDADVSNSSLARKVTGAKLVSGGNADAIVKTLEDEIVREVIGEHRSMVIDTGNGSDASSRRWFASEEMVHIMQEEGVRVCAITVIDSSPDSASHVLETMDALKGAEHIIVKNLGHVPGDVGEIAFHAMLSDTEFGQYLKRAEVITMPRLADVIAIDSANARLHQIADGSNAVPLSPFVIARTKSWLKDVTAQFERAIY